MGEDAGVDRARLLYFFAQRKVLVDAVDPHRARIVERYENIFRRNVGTDVDGARRQPYRRTVRRESATRRVDAKRGDVMLGPGRAITWSAAAGRNIKVASRYMRPSILHAGRQGDRRLLDQFRTRDIDIVMRQVGADVGI
jgi:hypothetical protein